MTEHLWRHQNSGGIHPGAFVQPRPPDTSQIQDRTLWIDNSLNEPYPIFSWDATARVWRACGRGAPGPAGRDAALPAASEGDLLVYISGSWIVLPPADAGLVLTLVGSQGQIVPQWDQSCCAQESQKKIGSDPWTGGAGNPPDWGRCGAGLAMALWLEEYYANVISLYHMYRAAGISLRMGDLLRDLVAAAEAIEPGAWVDWIEKALWPLAKWLLGSSISLVDFGTLDDTEKGWVLRSIYCCLESVSGPSAITSDTISCWGTNLFRLFGAPILPGPANLMDLLMQVPGLGTWQAIASRGMQVPTSACAGIICGRGGAMSGGAHLATPHYNAMSGGAVREVPGLGALTGGAKLAANRGKSLTGGAEALA